MNALPLIVFDVNETLLDLTTLEPTFERIFGDKGAIRLWFANLIIMPTSGLCRVFHADHCGSWGAGARCRHNQSPSRKASRSSLGR